MSRRHIRESAEASLRRLQTDDGDLGQARRYDYETPLEETLRAFDDLVRQGTVLYLGAMPGDGGAPTPARAAGSSGRTRPGRPRPG